METQETINDIVAAGPVEAKEPSPVLPRARPAAQVRPAQAACPTCGAGAGGAMANASYVYVLGQIEERYPRPSVEKEVAQATGRAETAGRTDRQAFHQILSQRENRYLARQLCWVLSVQGIETYLLQPRDRGRPRSPHQCDRASASAVDQHGHRRSGPGRSAGLLQRIDAADRRG